MNRALRRQLAKKDRLNNKANSKHMRSIGADILCNPCCYCNSKPLYVGDAIFLKPQRNTQFTYDYQLNNLVRDNHRFVIVVHRGLGKGTCAIALLSTSEYLNKQKRRGIQLRGNYNNTKDVFVDAYNIWVIDTDAILKRDYSLTEEDAFRCTSMSYDSGLPIKSVKIGTYGSQQVTDSFDIYASGLTQKAPSDVQEDIDYGNITNFTKDLSMNQLTKIINAASPEIVSFYSDIVKDRIKTQGLSLDALTYTRWLANVCLHFDSNLEDLIKRGYFEYE